MAPITSAALPISGVVPTSLPVLGRVTFVTTETVVTRGMVVVVGAAGAVAVDGTQLAAVNTLLSRVTAPLRASARP